MRIHHLNCIWNYALAGKLMDWRTPFSTGRGELACPARGDRRWSHSRVPDLGTRDVAHPRSRFSAFFLALLSPDFRDEMTAIRQIERIGFRGSDVRHIVLTHLDFDHDGGLDAFPHTTVQLSAHPGPRHQSWD